MIYIENINFGKFHVLAPKKLQKVGSQGLHVATAFSHACERDAIEF